MHPVVHLPTLLLALILVVSGIAVGPRPVAASEVAEPPPYKMRQFDLVDLVYDELPWTNEWPQILPAYPPFDEAGVPLFRWRDGKFYYRPGGLAINGMKRIDSYRDTGNPEQLKQALLQAEKLRELKIVRNDAWWLPFRFDYPPEGMKAPWFNAMAQGLVLSFFVRLYRVTGDEIHLEAAESVFQSFQRLGRKWAGRERPWVAFVDDVGYLWLEHYPNAKPDHVLNAHLHALIGLYEYWQLTRSPEARQLLEGALTTMRDRAGLYRREGRVSIYGMRSRTNILKYHRIHVWQLRLLGRMTGDSYFTELGDALDRDASSRGYVAGRPAAQRRVKRIGSAPVKWRIAPYPPVMPALERAA
ncbi:MAG: D-glucuronyl C5-epimerase family protein [Chloroflexota bacterium]